MFCVKCGESKNLDIITYAKIDKSVVSRYIHCNECGLENKIRPEEKEELMFKDAKVGDRVWSMVSKWGHIESIDGDFIKVRYDAGGYDEYTPEGCYPGYYQRGIPFPILYWDEVKITPPPRPKRKVKKSMVGYVNYYSDGLLGCSIYSTREVANKKATVTEVTSSLYRIGEAIKIVHEWEEEE